MKLMGQIAIEAPSDRVWAMIVDPVGLASCVPGVQEVRAIDDHTFAGSITAAIGPLQGDFAFTSEITSADFPDLLTVEMAGIDSVTKSRLDARVRVTLTEDAARTVLAYVADVTIGGRLAILGEMVVRATAGLMIAHVTECLRARLVAGTSPSAPVIS